MPGDPPFSFGYRYRLVNGHALTRQELQRKYVDRPLDREYASLMCYAACESLTGAVDFPPECDVGALRIACEVQYIPRPLISIDDYDADSLKLHAQESARVQIQREQDRIVLRCSNPVPGFIYRLLWGFPDTQNGRRAPSLTAESRALAGKARLLKLARNAAAREPQAVARYSSISLALVELARYLKGMVRGPEDETLDLSLMVFDEDCQKLRFVAATFGDIAELVEQTFVSGEGCGGFAFEKVRPMLYHPRRDEVGYYILPEELGARVLDPQECLLSLPWLYPSEEALADDTKVTVGVNVGSQAMDSGLVELFDLPEEVRSNTILRLRELTTEFANDILELR